MRRALVAMAAFAVMALGLTTVQAASASLSPVANSTPTRVRVPLSPPLDAAQSRTVSATDDARASDPRAIRPRASAKGAKGQTLTVTPTSGLSTYGQTLAVSGRGFSELVGIYVGLCVMPRPGAKPTPCGGGVDQDGSSQASAWISSNPPPYGSNLAIPYKRGGKFSVRIKVSPRIGSYDCRVVRCSVVARADHTRANDRTWDVAVPVSFR